MDCPRLAATVLVSAVLAVGCSSGGGPRQAAPTTTTTTPAERVASTKTLPLSAFCGRVTFLVKATAQIGTATQLSEVQARLASVAQLVDDAAAGGTPAGSGLFPTLVALDADMKVVNHWIQTAATQADLDQNHQPADVQAKFTDLGVRFRALQAWSNPHCKAFGSGDTS